ncbi:MAG: hypothetical protein AB1344_10270 [Pseudomonadota bacterium]
MHPTPRGPGDDQAPLEGEVLSARGAPHVAEVGQRFVRPLRIFWLLSLAVTGWLAGLTVHAGLTGVLDILLVLLLILPFGVLSLVFFALGKLLKLVQRSATQIDSHLRAEMEGRDPRMAAMNLRYTLEELRGEAGDLVMLRFMLTPGFFGLVGLSVLATIIMIPVALFTLLFKLF